MIAKRSPVVVTGAAGILGSRLVPWLEEGGRVVRPVDIRETDHPRGIVDDLREPRDRTRWMSGARALVHLGGIPNPMAPWSAVERANVITTRHMVEAARLHGIERLVLASSVWAMRAKWESGGMIDAGPPQPGDGAYGRSKAAAEAL
ncbi:MAG: NAD(P)-dependent oxidoreductase, partial [Rhodoglobus sp.]|nr:NAD(P)-dependent oxidoreductase [Rhodoglobus sp.]